MKERTNRAKKKAWQRGVNITVSPRAHKKLSIASVIGGRNLREEINLLMGLPKHA